MIISMATTNVASTITAMTSTTRVIGNTELRYNKTPRNMARAVCDGGREREGERVNEKRERGRELERMIKN